MNSSIADIISHVLRILGIGSKKWKIKDIFEKHPFSPSVLSISDTLKELGVDNLILQLDSNSYSRINELPTPFIGYSNIENGEFIVIEDTCNSTVKYHSSKTGKTQESQIDFFAKWNGLAIVLFPTPKANRIKFNIHIFILEHSLILLSCFAFIYLISLYLVLDSWELPALLSIKFLGIAVTFLLIKHETTAENSIVANTGFVA